MAAAGGVAPPQLALGGATLQEAGIVLPGSGCAAGGATCTFIAFTGVEGDSAPEHCRSSDVVVPRDNVRGSTPAVAAAKAAAAGEGARPSGDDGSVPCCESSAPACRLHVALAGRPNTDDLQLSPPLPRLLAADEPPMPLAGAAELMAATTADAAARRAISAERHVNC